MARLSNDRAQSLAEGLVEEVAEALGLEDDERWQVLDENLTPQVYDLLKAVDV